MDRDARTGLATFVAILSGLVVVRHAGWQDGLAVGIIIGLVMIWADALTGKP